MTLIYGANVLRKLVEAYERDLQNQRACEKYLREQTVPSPLSTVRCKLLIVDALSKLWRCHSKEHGLQ